MWHRLDKPHANQVQPIGAKKVAISFAVNGEVYSTVIFEEKWTDDASLILYNPSKAQLLRTVINRHITILIKTGHNILAAIFCSVRSIRMRDSSLMSKKVNLMRNLFITARIVYSPGSFFTKH